MAIQTQGGLGQASAAQTRPAAPVQAGGRFDAGAAQAENLEKMGNVQQPTMREQVADDLGDQREAMNTALKRMRDSLDDRKSRLFDPVLMQTAAGFLKPTKTGSFGESLGYAAENAGVAAEREAAFQRENQKLEMELLSKEQDLRQQLGGDQLVSMLLGGPQTGGAPPPAAGAVTTPGGQLRVPGTASPVDVATLRSPEQVLTAARQGRIPITDEVLLLASRRAPQLLATLKEIRTAQEGEERNRIEREKLENTTRKVKPHGGLTEREMNRAEYNEYLAQLAEYEKTGDEQKLLRYYMRKGWLESNQISAYKPTKEGETPTAIPRSKTQTEIDVDKETLTTTAKGRAEEAEKKATRLSTQAEAAFENTNIAKDMIGYARNNPMVFQIMNKPGLANAVARAVEQGVNAGNFNISLPAATIAQYQLSENDLTALQMFMQKNAQLQTRGRQLNRTPGEGSMSDFETRLLGGIYALPSDSARAIILKSDALILQGLFDENRFKLWNQKSKQPGYTYNDFLVDDDFKALKESYRKTLDRVREENLDLLTPRRRESGARPSSGAAPASAPAASAPARPASAPASAPAPAPAPAPASQEATQPPANEKLSERLKRLQKERQQQSGG